MITLQDRINELRAELRGCLTRRERATIAAELEAAIAALKKYDRALRRIGRLDEGRRRCARYPTGRQARGAGSRLRRSPQQMGQPRSSSAATAGTFRA
jgi:hypothetical protein